MQPEIDEARRLHRRGQSDSSIALLHKIASTGSIDAMIELAHIERDLGRKAESDAWIDNAEAALKHGDLDGHVSLNAAYSLGLGRGEQKDIEARALHHLQQVALSGNTSAQEELALYYLYGLNGCEKDVMQFDHWIGLAVAANSPRAAYILAEHLHKEGKQVAPQLIEKLNEARSHNKYAAKLVSAIAAKKRHASR